MSEAQRSRLYDWWCEQTDEPLAEYAMSCLSPVPLPDLATKADILATNEDMRALKEDVRALKEDVRVLQEDMREVKEDVRVLKEEVARLDAKVTELEKKVAALDAKFAALDAKVDYLALQINEERRVSQVRHYWLAGIGLAAAVPIWLSTASIIG